LQGSIEHDLRQIGGWVKLEVGRTKKLTAETKFLLFQQDKGWSREARLYVVIVNVIVVIVAGRNTTSQLSALHHE